MLKLRFNLAT